MPNQMKYRILDILLFSGSYILVRLFLFYFFKIATPYDAIISGLSSAFLVVLVKSLIPVKLTRKDKTE